MPLVHTETMCWLTPPPPLSPSHLPPVLSMISAALCRSVQIESGIDEDVATLVGGGLASSLVGKVPQQSETNRQMDMQTDSEKETYVGSVSWLCPTLPSRLWVASFDWSFGCCTRTPCTAPVCADWLFFLHGMGMLYALHIPLSLAGSIRCLLSLSFLHKSTVVDDKATVTAG